VESGPSSRLGIATSASGCLACFGRYFTKTGSAVSDPQGLTLGPLPPRTGV